jgi:acetyl esterase
MAPSRSRIVLDESILLFLDGRARQGPPSLHGCPVPEARKALAEAQSRAVPALPLKVDDVSLPAGAAGTLRIRIFRPFNGSAWFPVVLYFHGGCWVMGDVASHDRFVRELAAGAQAAVVFVEYSLAPEAQFPVPIEEAYAALEGVVRHAEELQLDASRIVVAGDCAGGTLAAVVALLAKARRGPEIALQLLLYPVLAEPQAGDEQAAAGWLTPEQLRDRIDAAFPRGAARQEITAFPLNASILQLNDLPEALVLVAEHDITRDDTEAYARRLTEAGVTVTCTRYIGAIHDFMVLNALAQSALVRSATAQAVEAVHRALYRP